MSVTTDQLMGTWTLQSWTRTADDGSVSYPYGENAQGRLIYAPSGQMSGFLMDPEYKTLGNKAGRHMVLSYLAQYHLEGDVVHHDVEMSSTPGLIGEALRRQVSLEDDIMTLKTLTSIGREDRGSFHTLVWQRL